MNEPKRHHYIPQFILKNFCFDNKKHVSFFDKRTKQISVLETCNVFMSPHLYRDEINSPDDPVKLEKDFARFENEISRIIKSKFLDGDSITLNMEEDAKLRLFFAIMGFRAKKTRDLFAKGLSKESKDLYARSQPDLNFLDLWKRNLGYIVNCRSIQEIICHPEIDEHLKIFFERDTFGIAGMYFAVADCEGCDEFIIGDCYPVVVIGDVLKPPIQKFGKQPLKIHMYSVFPVSPNRVIFMMSNGVDNTPRGVLGFRAGVATLPKMNEDGTYTIRTKELYPEEVKFLNAMIFKEAKEGVICKSSNCGYLYQNS